jgi:low temperature requirement protein LtrA
MSRVFAPLRLRALGGHDGRKVTWLELFFDLVFVAAIAQVAGPLHEHYEAAGVLRFAVLFALIWWAWVGHAFFATRFETTDLLHRVLTLLQMFVVTAMAANAGEGLDSRSTAGFTAAYAALRLVLVGQYARALAIAEARPLARRCMAGCGLAAVIWLASALIPVPIRYWLWAAAFVLDLGTPWLAARHALVAPPDAHHLPERFGLFTLILLGESIVAVMHGMESQEHWSPAAAVAALLGIALVSAIWWWYFHGIGAAGERPVRSRRDWLHLQGWSYAHFPLYLGVVVTGVGMQRIVAAAARSPLEPGDPAIVAVAAALLMAAMGGIAAARSHGPRAGVRRLPARLGIATLTLAAGLAGAPTSPVVVIVGLAAACAAQLAIARA